MTTHVRVGFSNGKLMPCQGSGFARACGKITFLPILAGGDVACEARTQLRMAASITIGLRLLLAHLAPSISHMRAKHPRRHDRFEAVECSGIGKYTCEPSYGTSAAVC